jgi:hypothetical protein
VRPGGSMSDKAASGLEEQTSEEEDIRAAFKDSK